MKKDMIIYDKNGEKLKIGDRLSDGYDKDNWLSCYYGDELYFFYPIDNKLQCARWALIVDLLNKEGE
jgi:hypothetical protein